MESFKQEWKSFKLDLTQSLRDMFRDNNELIFQEIKASENRMTRNQDSFKVEIRQEMHAMKDEIITEITEFIDDRLLPQIDDHDQRLIKLETKTI